MHKVTLTILAASLLASAQVVAQTVGESENIAPPGSSNFVAVTASSQNTSHEGISNLVLARHPATAVGTCGLLVQNYDRGTAGGQVAQNYNRGTGGG